MKNIRIIAFGLAMLGIVVIGISEAARSRFLHRPLRTISNRDNAFHNYRAVKQLDQKSRRQFWLARSFNKKQRSSLTTSVSSIPRIVVRRRRQAIVRPTLKANTRFQNISARRLNLEIPDTFKQKADGLFHHRYSSLAFKIVKTPAKYTCTKSRFLFCIRALGEDFLNSQEIYKSKNLAKKTKWKRYDTEDGVADYPNTFEAFEGNIFGQDNVYFIFSALDPEDNSILRIEAVADKKELRFSSETFISLIQSFKF